MNSFLKLLFLNASIHPIEIFNEFAFIWVMSPDEIVPEYYFFLGAVGSDDHTTGLFGRFGNSTVFLQ